MYSTAAIARTLFGATRCFAESRIHIDGKRRRKKLAKPKEKPRSRFSAARQRSMVAKKRDDRSTSTGSCWTVGRAIIPL